MAAAPGRALIAALSVAVLAASGCGSEEEQQARLSKADYQDELLAVLEDSDEPTILYTDLVVESRPPDECAEGVATLHDQIEALVDRVDELEPPEGVQPIQDDFVAAARRSLDRIDAVREEAAAGQVRCGEELNAKLYGLASSADAERAIARLERRGYTIFGE
jgi:hypothetical protein